MEISKDTITKTTLTLEDVKELFEEYFLSSDSDIYMFLENFDDLEDIFFGIHPKIRDFCDKHKIFIVLKNYNKYNQVKTDFKRNIFNYSNIYLRGLKNYFEDDWCKEHNIEPIQSLCHTAYSYINCNKFYWINNSHNIGEDFNQFEGLATNYEKVFKNMPETNESLLRQSKPLNEREIEGIDYFKRDEKEDLFENTGCLVYFIPVILISLMFLIL